MLFNLQSALVTLPPKRAAYAAKELASGVRSISHQGAHQEGGSLIRERGTLFVAGLLLGVLVGAALMGLFAPAEGERTRRALLKQGATLRRRAILTAEDASSQVQERVQGMVALASRPFTKRKRGLARLRFWEGR